MNAVNWAVANWQTLLAIFGGLVGVATTVVKLTPSVTDDHFMASVVKVLNFLSTVNPKPPAKPEDVK